MSLVGLLIAVIIFGVLFWLVTLLPLPAPFNTIVRVVLVLICILWLVAQLGMFGPNTLRISALAQYALAA